MNRLAIAARADEDIGMMEAETALAGRRIVLHAFGALYLPDSRLVVVSDLHLEKGAAFARRGRMLPPYDTLATLKILEAVIARFDPATIVSLGDNFHDREGSKLMPEPFRQMIVGLANGRQWLWINGNHDPDGICGLPGQSADQLHLGGLTFRHEPSKNDCAGEIAGHLHPAATVRRREKAVRRPCFATDGRRLIMPSFGVMTGGLDLGHRAFRGLFDKETLVAHLLGQKRVYSVRHGNLTG